MTETDNLPAYNDAAEIERRSKLAQQSPLSVDKPGQPQGQLRIRNMKVKRSRKRSHRRNLRKNPIYY